MHTLKCRSEKIIDGFVIACHRPLKHPGKHMSMDGHDWPNGAAAPPRPRRDSRTLVR